MIVTLAGPDDQGFWFLDDDNGRSFQLVECFEDHPQAAALLGWTCPDGVTDESAIIFAAMDYLNDHVSESFKAPLHIAEYFKQFDDET